MEERKKVIVSILHAADAYDVLAMWNDYIAFEGEPEDYIAVNDEEFFKSTFGDNIMGVVRAVSYGMYSYTDEFVKLDAGGNLRSFCDAADAISVVDYEKLADHIIDSNCHDFEQVWIDDLTAGFINYADAKYGLYFNEESDFGCFNFVTDDWDRWLTDYQKIYI